MAKTPDIAIPWPLSTAPGARPQESAGRLINCSAEPLGETAGAKAAWHRQPGVSAFATTGIAGYRGSILVNNLLYVALSGKLVTVNSAGVVTVAGNLAGTQKVTFAKNNKAPTPDIQCVDPSNGAFAVTSVSVTAFSAGGILPAPNSVCFQDGYFFWTIGDRRVFASALNDTAVNALTFATMQSRSSGSLIRGIAFKGLTFYFTTSSCEIWSDTANAAPGFPYSRLSVADRGLLGYAAIAGHDENFGNLLWASDDYGVYRLDATFQPQKVSPPDLDRLIQAQAKVDATLLEAGCYVDAGKSFWVLSSPTWTWEFNLASEKWNERSSFASGLLTRWRGTGGVNAFGKWIVGDYQTGNLCAIDRTNYTELGVPLLFRMESGPVEMFPNRMRVARADFEAITGVGIAASSSANLTNPQCSISWSDDGGVYWSNPLLRSLGAQSQSTRRISLTGLGKTGPQGRRWRYDVSDPVYAGLLGATMNASPRAW